MPANLIVLPSKAIQNLQNLENKVSHMLYPQQWTKIFLIVFLNFLYLQNNQFSNSIQDRNKNTKNYAKYQTESSTSSQKIWPSEYEICNYD